MEKYMNIALDCDGVICNFYLGFSRIANKLFGTPIVTNINDIKTYRWENWYPMNKKQHNAVWQEIDDNVPNFWLDLQPLVNNDIFLRMQNMGHNFFFITSRKNTAGHTALAQTKAWIERHTTLSSFSVIPSHRKGEILDRAEIEYFIDDLPENVIEAAIEAPKCKSYLLVRPYNAYAISFFQQSHKFKNVGIVYSVEAFLDEVENETNKNIR